MPQLFSNGFAVIIGAGADLPVTIADAKAIDKQLRDPTRCAYESHHVRLLTEKDARREDILSALEWLAEKAGKDDTAIVYFSGHGIELPDFHLLPFGFELNNLADTAITHQEFTERLRSIRAKKLLLLLDCCHAGGQAEVKGYKSPIPPAAIVEFGNSSGRVMIASSRKWERSQIGHPYSEFTKAALESLSGYGAFERDGYARVLDLALWVNRVVPERTNNTQHPIIKVSNLQDNFALAWYAGGEKSPKPLPWTAGMPEMDAGTARMPEMHAGLEGSQRAILGRMLKNFRDSLLLIEERMSEYVERTTIPLQLLKEKQQIEAKIADVAHKLGIEMDKEQEAAAEISGRTGNVERTTIPLQLLKEKRQTETKIADVAHKLDVEMDKEQEPAAEISGRTGIVLAINQGLKRRNFQNNVRVRLQAEKDFSSPIRLLSKLRGYVEDGAKDIKYNEMYVLFDEYVNDPNPDIDECCRDLIAAFMRADVSNEPAKRADRQQLFSAGDKSANGTQTSVHGDDTFIESVVPHIADRDSGRLGTTETLLPPAPDLDQEQSEQHQLSEEDIFYILGDMLSRTDVLYYTRIGALWDVLEQPVSGEGFNICWLRVRSRNFEPPMVDAEEYRILKEELLPGVAKRFLERWGIAKPAKPVESETISSVRIVKRND